MAARTDGQNNGQPTSGITPILQSVGILVLKLPYVDGGPQKVGGYWDTHKNLEIKPLICRANKFVSLKSKM